jgi:arylsulfatase A-like enzyme
LNVLLITTDQQRADTIGAYGNPVCQTPNLDRLARDGVRFDACRTQNPYCQPSRATILTGTYPSTHGVICNGFDLPADAESQAVSTRFREAGYRTALIGKAHFSSIYPSFPTGRLESVDGSSQMQEGWTGPYFGFEHAEMILFGHMLRMSPITGMWNWCFGPPPLGLHYARFLFRDGPERGRERLRLMQPEAAGAVWDRTQTWKNAVAEEDHPTTWVAERAIDWLRSVDDPFFAWVSFTDPHHPMDPPKPWCDLYDPADCLSLLPEPHPEEFEEKPPQHRLISRGMGGSANEWANPGGANYSREDLAKMFAGYYGMVSQLDHQIGRVVGVLEEKGILDDTLVLVTTDHGELLGDHQMVFKGPVPYEGLLRIPLIARGPGFPAGTVVDDPVGSIDLGPTALAAAGLGVPDWMEGSPLLDGPREHALTENDHTIFGRLPLRTLSTRRYKITRYLEHPHFGELYDLEQDPGEVVNRWDDPACKGLRSDLLATLGDVMNESVRELPQVGVVG